MKFTDELESPNVLCFNDVIKVVSAEQLIENLIIATNRGSLIVHGMPPRFLRDDFRHRYGETMTHFGEVNSLQASVCGKFVFSAGSDGIIFMYAVVEHTPVDRRRFGGMASKHHESAALQQHSHHETNSHSMNSARIEKERPSVM